MTLTDLLARAAAEAPDQGVVHVGPADRFVGYAQLFDDALRVAGGLRAAGLSPGDPLLVVADDSEDFLTLFWAAVLAGVVPVPLPPEPDRLAAVRRLLSSPALAGDDIVPGALSLSRLRASAPLPEPHRAQPDDLAFLQFSSGSTGTPKGVELTHRNVVTNLEQAARASGSGPDDVVVTWMPYFHDMGLIGTHLTPVYLRCRQVRISPMAFAKRPETWLRVAEKHRGTLLSAANFALALTLRRVPDQVLDTLDLSRVRLLMVGAEPISPAVWRAFAARMTRAKLDPAALAPVYGLAEATVAVAFPPPGEVARPVAVSRAALSRGVAVPVLPPTGSPAAFTGSTCSPAGAAFSSAGSTAAPAGPAATPAGAAFSSAGSTAAAAGPAAASAGAAFSSAGSTAAPAGPAAASAGPAAVEFMDVGYPVPGCAIRIVDDAGVPVEDGLVGNVQVSGPNVTRGYHRDPAATATAIVDGWLRTGDIGFLRQGRLVVSGREKDVLFVNGRNFHAADLEEVAAATPGLGAGPVAVVGATDPAGGREVVGVFVAAPAVRADPGAAERARRRVAEALAYDDVRVEVVPRGAFARTTSGKLRRQPLRERLMTAFPAPPTATSPAAVPDVPASPTPPSPAGVPDVLPASPTPPSAADVPGSCVAPRNGINSRAEMERLVRTIWGQVLRVSPDTIGPDDRFLAIGGSSLAAMEVLAGLEDALGRTLDPALLRDGATVPALADRLLTRTTPATSVAAAAPGEPGEPGGQREAGKPGGRSEPGGQREPGGPRKPGGQGEPGMPGELAVIGMACRFPDADTPEQFWDNLVNGRDSVRPSTRWAGHGAFLDDPSLFDAGYFGIGDTEARYLDPHARIFLELAHEALERAGYAGPRRHARRIGVFAAVGESAYPELVRGATTGTAAPGAGMPAGFTGSTGTAASGAGMPAGFAGTAAPGAGMPADSTGSTGTAAPGAGMPADSTGSTGTAAPGAGMSAAGADALTGSLRNLTAARVAHLLDLHGPAVAIDTACSSALVALHLARLSLAAGDCDVAVVGGVNLNLTTTGPDLLAGAQALSPTGRCRAFADDADGFVAGEGGAVIVLSRAADASDDRVLALVKATAVNNDGRSLSLLAPNPVRQREVVAEPYRRRGVDPAGVTYIEAHGTGTPVGDPIEARSLAYAFNDGRRRLLGSVKTNIGHLLNAAGMPALLKVILAFQHGELPPSLHHGEPSRRFDLAAAGFEVLTERRPWTGPLAAVNSFGFGGTNAHAVLAAPPPSTAEEREPHESACANGVSPRTAPTNDQPHEPKAPAPHPPAPASDQPHEPGAPAPHRTAPANHRPHRAGVGATPHTGTAHTGPHLLTLSARSAKALAVAAADLANHLRRHPGLREFDVCASASVARDDHPYRIALVSQGDLEARLAAVPVGPPAGRAPRVAFVAGGQGTQTPGQGARLYASAPAFRDALDEMSENAGPVAGRSLIDWCIDPDVPAEELSRTEVTQPLVVAFAVAQAVQLRAYGVIPDAVAGHGIGELAAAAVAGLLTPAEAVTLAAERGRLTAALTEPGAMLAVAASATEIAHLLSDRVVIAAENAPRRVVLAGPAGAIDAVTALLTGAGVTTKRLAVTHAFHSPAMSPVTGPLGRLAPPARPATTPLLSTVTGEWGAVFDAAYLADHAVRPVRFGAAVARLRADGFDTFVELGARTTLAPLIRAGFHHRDDRPDAGTGEIRIGQARGDQAGGSRTPADQIRAEPIPAEPIPAEPIAAAPIAAEHNPPEQIAAHGEPGIRVRAAGADARALLETAADLWTHGATLDRTHLDAGSRRVTLPTYPFQRRRYWIAPPVTLSIPVWTDAPAVVPAPMPAPASTAPITTEPTSVPAPAPITPGPTSVPVHVVTAADPLPALRTGHLLVVTEDVFATGAGPENHDPVQAVRVGLAMASADENPALRVRVIDLSTADSADERRAAIEQEALLPWVPGPASVVAWRGGRRLRRSFRPARPAATAPPGSAVLPPDGSYLIVGGAGAAGSEIARDLARRGRPSLLLAGRSAEPVALIAELRALGAEAEYRSADVSVPADVEALVAGRSFDVVVQAAGVVRPGSLRSKTPAEIAAGIAAKVDGTRLLAAAVTGREVLFVALSSVSSVLPGLAGAIGDYVAGNAYLDAYAAAERAAGRRFVAVNLPALEGGGLAARAGAGRAAKAGRGDRSGADTDGALPVWRVPEVLWPAVELEAAQVLVTAQTPPNARVPAGTPIPATAAAGAGIGTTTAGDAGNRPPTGGGHGYEALVATLRELLSAPIGRDGSSIGLDEPFLSLGLDSLTAVDLVKALEQRLGRTLSTTLFFEHRTVGELARHFAAPERFPLNPVQRAFHTSGRLYPEVPAYAYVRQTVTGPLDLDRLRGAFVALEQRHPMLRVRIDADGQRFAAPGDASWFRVVTLDGPVAALDAELRNRTFDLTREAPVRAVLALDGPERAHLLVVAHHAAADGYSLAVLGDELWTLYTGSALGPAPARTFADHAVVAEAGDLAYWRSALAQYPPLALPFEGPAEPRPPYAVHQLSADAQLTADLTAAARASGVSLFHLLLAAYVRCLSRWARQPLVPVLVARAGRDARLAGIDRMVGPFADTLPVLVPVDLNEPVGVLAGRLGGAWLVSEQHGSVSTVDLARLLAGDGSGPRTASPASFSFARFPSTGLTAADQVVETVAGTASAATRLGLVCFEARGALHFSWNWPRALFGTETVRRFAAEHLAEVRAAAAPGTSMPAASSERGVSPGDAGELPLVERIRAQCRRTPAAVAVLTGGQPLSYLDLDLASDRLAARLAETGARRIGLLTGAGQDTVVGLVGILKAGAAWVPLDPAHPPARLADQLERAGAAVVVCDASTRAAARRLRDAARRAAPVVRDVPSSADGSAPGQGPGTNNTLSGEQPAPDNAIASGQPAAGTATATGQPAPGTATATGQPAPGTAIAGELPASGRDRPGGAGRLLLVDVRAVPLGAPPPVRTRPDDLAYVIFTSGSTGRPKGVPISHRAMTNYLDWAITTFGYGPGDRLAQTASICFDASVRQLLAPLLAGATVVAWDRDTVRDPDRLLDRVERDGITVWSSVPTLWERLLRAAENRTTPPDLSRLRWVHVGGEELSPAHVRRWFDLFGTGQRITNLYGPTETTINATCHVVAERPADDVLRLPIGRPVGGAIVEVVGADGRPCDPGEIGELQIGGAGLSDGYLDDPDQTATAFIDRAGRRWYRSGDRAARDADGLLWFRGRVDDQVKLHGYRIEPGEIVAALRRHPAVDNADVRVDAGRLTARIQPRGHLKSSELRAFLAEFLAPYMIPSRFDVVTALPRTPTGKLDRAAWTVRDTPALSEQDTFAPSEQDTPAMSEQDTFAMSGQDSCAASEQDTLAGSVLDTPALSETEQVLAHAWSAQLGVARIGRDDDYFALGGDSISALDLWDTLAEKLPVLPRPTVIYRHSTLRALAAAIDEAARSATELNQAGRTEAERTTTEPTATWPTATGQSATEPPATEPAATVPTATRPTATERPRAVSTATDRTAPVLVEPARPGAAADAARPVTGTDHNTADHARTAGDYALTPSQRGFLLADAVGAPATWLAAPRLHGPLDPERFQRAVDVLVERHPMLRTAFRTEARPPVQHELPSPGRLVVGYVPDPGPVADELAAERAHRFDPATWPLLRLRLLRTSAGEHVLLIHAHHLIGDGYSVTLLLKELFTLYDGRELPPLRSTFRDYARLLDGLTPEVVPGGALHHGAVSTVGVTVPGRASFLTVLTAYRRGLISVSGSPEPVIGVAVTGRDHVLPDLPRIFGPCATAVAVPTFADQSEQALAEAVAEARTRTFRAPHGWRYFLTYLDFTALGAPQGDTLSVTWDDDADAELTVPPGTEVMLAARPVDGGLRLTLRGHAPAPALERLAAELRSGLTRLDAALIGYLPAPEQLTHLIPAPVRETLPSLDRESIRAVLFPDGRARLLETVTTPLGRSGFVCLPRFADELGRAGLAEETAAAVDVAAAHGARSVSLAGMIPAHTGYGAAVAQRTSTATQQPDTAAHRTSTATVITTGHAVTAASVVRTTLAALTAQGRKPGDCVLAVVGVGSIGSSSLRLLLDRVPQRPAGLILCDLPAAAHRLAGLAAEVTATGRAATEADADHAAHATAADRTTHTTAADADHSAHATAADRSADTTAASSGAAATGRRAAPGRAMPVEIATADPAAPDAVYRADVIIAATSGGPGTIDIDRLRPGTIVVDDSFPHCFDTGKALARMRTRGDILVVGGGLLDCGPSAREVAAGLPPVSFGLPGTIASCQLESLLHATMPGLPRVLGPVRADQAAAYWDALDAAGVRAAPLHLLGTEVGPAQ